MDTRCPSCSTLFEPSAGEADQPGENVRCPACGQSFRLRKADGDAAPDQWRVRHEATGEILPFDDFTTLQRWIVEEKLSREDEISRSGGSWTQLGTINELKAYFRVVDELNAPPPTRADLVVPGPPKLTERETGSTAAVDDAFARAEARAAAEGFEEDLPEVRPARQSQPLHVSRVEAALQDIDARKRGEIPMSTALGSSSSSSLGPAYSGPAMRTDAPILEVGASGASGGRGKGAGAMTWVLAVLLLVAIGVIGVGLLKPELFGLYTAPAVPPDAGAEGPAPDDASDALAAAAPDAAVADAPLDAPDGTGEGSAAAAEGSGVEGSGAGSGEGSGTSAVVAAIAPDAGTVEAARPDTTTAVARRDPEPPPERRAEAREEPEEPSGPQGFDALMAAGNAALDSGDAQTALRHFSNAADERSTNAEAQMGMARAYEEMGRYDRAADRYERATRINSRYTPAWMGLGDARRRAGDTSGACEAYARVLTLARAGRWAERAQAAIEEIGCE